MNRIKELRLKYNLSLRELQKYTTIDFSRLAVLEKTDANMESKTIEKLCSFFNVSPSYLLGKDGFVKYFDKYNNRFFDLAYEQFKDILTDDVVITSIHENCIKREITVKGYEKLNKYNNAVSAAINNHIISNEYIKYLDSLNNVDLMNEIKKINDYLKTRNL